MATVNPTYRQIVSLCNSLVTDPRKRLIVLDDQSDIFDDMIYELNGFSSCDVVAFQNTATGMLGKRIKRVFLGNLLNESLVEHAIQKALLTAA